MAHLVALGAMTYPRAALLAVAVTVAAGAWTAQGWRMDTQVQVSKNALESLKREHAEALTRATAGALNATIKWQKVKDDALQAANNKEIALRRDAAGARRERDGLRDDLAATSVQLAGATHSSLVERTAAIADVFEQCTDRYSALAHAADRHALDAEKLWQSWPVMPPAD